jgi:hypothetical protein
VKNNNNSSIETRSAAHHLSEFGHKQKNKKMPTSLSLSPGVPTAISTSYKKKKTKINRQKIRKIVGVGLFFFISVRRGFAPSFSNFLFPYR